MGGQELHATIGRKLSWHRKYLAAGWHRQACLKLVREDQDYLTSCSGYTDLLQCKELDSNQDLVDFFTDVMSRREKNGWD